MKYVTKDTDEVKKRFKSILLLCAYYIVMGIVITFINSIIAPDFFYNIAIGITVVTLISLGLAVFPVYILKNCNASLLVILNNAILTIAFCALTLSAGSTCNLWFIIYATIMAIVMSFYGANAMPKSEKSRSIVLVAVCSAICCIAMCFVVVYFFPMSGNVHYNLRGNSYVVTAINNGENIEILSEINGKKVSSVRNGVFYYKTRCKTLVIPSSIAYIHSGALVFMKQLESLTINPSAVESQLNDKDGNPTGALFGELWYVGDDLTYANQDSAIPDSLTYVNFNGNVPAYYCYGLSTVTKIAFSSKAKSVGAYSFAFCESLKGVTSLGNITEIAQGAFGNCSKLTTVAPNEKLRTVGTGAFDTCSALTSFYFPETVETVGAYVFNNAYFYLQVKIVASQDEVLENDNWDKAWSLAMDTTTGRPLNQRFIITYNCNNIATE